jgi:hypothetical protein
MKTVSTVIGALRRQLLTPPLEDVLFSTRGFHTHDERARDILEMSGRQFVIGFEFAVESKDTAEVVARLETLEQQYRGFAYEGAAMALSLLDGLHRGVRGRHCEDFLSAGRGAAHIYMAYLGLGFAQARLPKPLRRRAIPDISKLPDHPTLSWMIWDGYGFHQAFFDPEPWIKKQYVGTRYPWQPVAYVNRAIDHGIGRAIWFYVGASVEAAAALVETFPEARRADLWSGVGLAATYAGGVDTAGLGRLRSLAVGYEQEISLGAVLAAKARVLADTVTDHTETAARALCDSSAAAAAAITDKVIIDLPPDGAVPAYEVFRERIREQFNG